MDNGLDINWLKENAQKIHFFGLGFIQVKINETLRYHFYHKDLPPFVESPHNHRYNFVSICLKGVLKSTFYEVLLGRSWAKFRLKHESCGRGKIPNVDVIDCDYRKRYFYEQDTIGRTQILYQHEEFHTIAVQKYPTITKIVREAPCKDFALVVEDPLTPDACPFSKVIPEEELWRLVEECLND